MMEQSGPSLEGRMLTLEYRRGRSGAPQRAVDHADICLGPGDRTALIGRSGSGKSTLLKLLLGLQAASTGSVTYAGTQIRPGSVASLRGFRQKVQYIPQEPAASLDPRLTVRHLVTDPLKRLRVPGDHLERAVEALDQVHLGGEFLTRRRGELSGGQAQRVAIARAIATGSQLLLADEPVSGLDLPLRDEVLQLLSELCTERGLGLLLITHDLDAARQVCHHGMVMSAGRIVERADMGQLLTRPQQKETIDLLAAVPRVPGRLCRPDPRAEPAVL